MNQKQKLYVRLMVSVPIIYYILVIICVCVDIGKYPLVSGLCLLAGDVLFRLRLQTEIKLEKRIRHEGKKVIATVKAYHHPWNTTQSSMIPTFEIELSDGVHLCDGIVPDDRVNTDNFQNFLNAQYSVYYAPALCTAVSYRSDKEFKNAKKGINASFACALAFAVVIIILGAMLDF